MTLESNCEWWAMLASQASISLEQESKVINGPLVRVANETASAFVATSVPVLSYLANSITAGELLDSLFAGDRVG